MWERQFGGLWKSEPEKVISKVKSQTSVHSQAVQTPPPPSTQWTTVSENENKLKSFKSTDRLLNVVFITHWKLICTYFHRGYSTLKMWHCTSIFFSLSFCPPSFTNLDPGDSETTWLSSSGTVFPHRLPVEILPGRETLITAFSHWSGN